MIRAIIKAQQWLDAEGGRNRAEAVKILAQPNYVGADAAVIAASMTGKFTFEPGDTRDAAGFNVFFDKFAGYPYYSDAVWYLTQMRRWGQIPADHDDQWYFDRAKAVYRPDLYLAAAKKLVDGGTWEDLVAYNDDETWREAGQGGFEIRTYIALAGTVEGCTGELWFYAPIPIFAVGCTIAVMHVDGASQAR